MLLHVSESWSLPVFYFTSFPLVRLVILNHFLRELFFFFFKKAINALKAVIGIAFARTDVDVEAQVKCSANEL